MKHPKERPHSPLVRPRRGKAGKRMARQHETDRPTARLNSPWDPPFWDEMQESLPEIGDFWIEPDEREV